MAEIPGWHCGSARRGLELPPLNENTSYPLHHPNPIFQLFSCVSLVSRHSIVCGVFGSFAFCFCEIRGLANAATTTLPVSASLVSSFGLGSRSLFPPPCMGELSSCGYECASDVCGARAIAASNGGRDGVWQGEDGDNSLRAMSKEKDPLRWRDSVCDVSALSHQLCPDPEERYPGAGAASAPARGPDCRFQHAGP